MTKEQVYDEKIRSLMGEIIRISKEHGIAMFASFALPDETQDTLRCTTHRPDENGVFDEHFSRCNAIVFPRRGPTMILRTDHADGGTTMTAILP